VFTHTNDEEEGAVAKQEDDLLEQEDTKMEEDI